MEDGSWAQNRPHLLLVQIQLQERIQEFLLALQNIARQGIFFAFSFELCMDLDEKNQPHL